MSSEWNAPKGKLGQCKIINIFSRLSFEDKCFHLLFASTFLHNHIHATCLLHAVLLAINTTFVVFVGCLHVSVSHLQCQGLSLISRFRYSHTLCICNCFSSGCLHFGEWHSTLGRASAVSGNTTASQIIVSRPRARAQCTVHIEQCTVHNPSYQLSMCNVQVLHFNSTKSKINVSFYQITMYKYNICVTT